jgi:hypothetical protein
MLAEASEPLILADGTKIDPSTGSVIKDKKHHRGGFIEIPSAGEAVALVAKTRRAVAELPVPTQQMNVIGLVLFYSMWGLSDFDIAASINGDLSSDQIKNIKKLPEYQAASKDILQSVLEYEANDIRTFMQQNAKGAASKIVELMDEEGALGFAAAKDVLDRAGHRPADVVEHRHKLEDSLKIEFISKKTSDAIPDVAIDADYRNITPEKF